MHETRRGLCGLNGSPLLVLIGLLQPRCRQMGRGSRPAVVTTHGGPCRSPITGVGAGTPQTLVGFGGAEPAVRRPPMMLLTDQ
jgi:hypothetical protein